MKAVDLELSTHFEFNEKIAKKILNSKLVMMPQTYVVSDLKGE